MREVNKATIERLPLAKFWCKTIPYFLKLLSQFGDCTSRMLS
ncbi:unnamed protein product [Acanthoscelides obtectus]|uniref:Uncharacterized protein n=1 Tax=Acanthoscelides obtectus TaxID=200917 RepID=A0A9P0M7G9_ACAOB|nr:unnamed protein product [Acanthoscelides obtectus]CAK1626682.1 hypothetical protein AOBTE_LOCUS4031 [Acanthoscelides obtectus]